MPFWAQFWPCFSPWRKNANYNSHERSLLKLKHPFTLTTTLQRWPCTLHPTRHPGEVEGTSKVPAGSGKSSRGVLSLEWCRDPHMLVVEEGEYPRSGSGLACSLHMPMVGESLKEGRNLAHSSLAWITLKTCCIIRVHWLVFSIRAVSLWCILQSLMQVKS